MDISREIKYINFHTHHGGGSDNTVAVVNLMAGDSVPDIFQPNTLFSAGIHPWYLTADNAGDLKANLLLSLAHPHVIMIGEAGFDLIRGPEKKLQYDTFCYQASLAEEMRRPVIIHCVKGWDLLLKAKEELRPSVKWIIHGFRGKGSLARTLAAEGFYFSLGLNGISDEIIDAAGIDRIMPETDASGEGISKVYSKFSGVTGRSEDELSAIFRCNFNSLFIHTDIK